MITVRLTAVSFCVYQIYITKSFYLDWAQKKELFIGMMLRAYSQEVFNPQSVFEEEGSEVGFTNRIEEHMKAFIINQLAGDTCIYFVYIYVYMYIPGCVYL